MSDYASELAELMPEYTTVPRQGIGINVRRLIKLRGYLMAIVFLGISVPLSLYIFLTVPKEFSAHADIEFKAVTPTIISDPRRAMTGQPYENFVNTQVKLIESPTILNEVLKDAEIQALPQLGNNPGALGLLIDRLEVDNTNRTELVSLSYSDESRDNAILVLRKIIEKYMEHYFSEEENRGGIARRTLADKEQELSTELAGYQSEINRLRMELKVPLGENASTAAVETESYRMNLAEAEADLTTAQTKLRQTEKLLSELEGLMAQHENNPMRPIFSLGVEEKIIADPTVTAMMEQMGTTQQDLAVLSDRYVDTAPQLQVKKREMEVIQGRLDALKSEIRGQMLHSLKAQYEYDRSTFEADRDDAQSRRDQFKALLDEHREETLRQSNGVAQIDDLMRREEVTRTTLAQVRGELFRMDVERNAPAQVSPLGEPWASHSPNSSRRIKYVFITLFAAITLATALGVGLELSDQNIRSAEDVGYVTDLPVLAAIPHQTVDRVPDNASIALVTAEHPGTFTADEFRRAVSRILNPPRGAREVRSCLIASPSRGDGKSTMACNLALVLAQAERKVLLVDIDSRNPSVERNFGMTPGPGLAELLAGVELQHDPDRSTPYDNLYVMGPGMRSRELVEMLASRDMRDFLEGAEEVFDHIIIDTPASLLMSETKLMAPMVDGVLVIVGAGVSTFGMLRRCLRALQDVDARLLGMIVNSITQAPGGYLKRNLDAFYAERGVGRTSRMPFTVPRRRRESPAIILMRGDEER